MCLNPTRKMLIRQPERNGKHVHDFPETTNSNIEVTA